MTSIEMTDYPEHPLWNRLRLARSWMPPGASDILDAGCAWGYGTRFFAGPGRRVYGVDDSADYIEVARARYPHIDFRCETLESLPLPDHSIHYVICADVLEHVADPVESLNQLHRVLRPDGHLFLSTPHRGLFGFLDPYNYGRNLRRHFPGVYSRLLPGKKWVAGMPLGDEHRHYTAQGLQQLLKQSRFGGGYRVEKTFRSGLLLYPIELNAGVVIDRVVPRHLRSFVKRPFQALAEVDYWIPFGPASFNIAMLIRKE